MERKEWGSKFERAEAALNSAELMRKHDKNLYLKDLAEAKKREENLKKAIEIERECLANVCSNFVVLMPRVLVELLLLFWG